MGFDVSQVFNNLKAAAEQKNTADANNKKAYEGSSEKQSQNTVTEAQKQDVPVNTVGNKDNNYGMDWFKVSPSQTFKGPEDSLTLDDDQLSKKNNAQDIEDARKEFNKSFSTANTIGNANDIVEQGYGGFFQGGLDENELLLNPSITADDIKSKTKSIEDYLSPESEEQKAKTFDEIAQDAGINDDELIKFMTSDTKGSGDILANWITSDNGLGNFYGEEGDEYGLIDKDAVRNGDYSSVYNYIDAMKNANPLYDNTGEDILIGGNKISLGDFVDSAGQNNLYADALLTEALMSDSTIGAGLIGGTLNSSYDGKSLDDILGIEIDPENITPEQVRQLADGLSAYNALSGAYDNKQTSGFSGKNLYNRLNDYLNLNESNTKTEYSEPNSELDILNSIASVQTNPIAASISNPYESTTQNSEEAIKYLTSEEGSLTPEQIAKVQELSNKRDNYLNNSLSNNNSFNNVYDRERDLIETIGNVRNNSNNNSVDTIQKLYGNLLNQDYENKSVGKVISTRK